MADTRLQPMTPPPRRARAPVDDTSFTRNMRYEFADAEGRAIMYSWIASCALGILWLLLVAFGPLVPPSIALLPQETPPIDVRV